jgi:hypothetical protein
MVAWTSGLGFKTCPKRRSVWHLHLPLKLSYKDSSIYRRGSQLFGFLL